MTILENMHNNHGRLVVSSLICKEFFQINKDINALNKKWTTDMNGEFTEKI